jgi:hypothetical protein
MTGTKVLQINPLLFSTNNKDKHSKTSKNRPKKEKPTQTIKGTSSMRKALLAKIRDYQKRDNDIQSNNANNALKNKMEINSQTSISSHDKDKDDEHVKEFDNEFNKSLGFLQELSKKHQDKKKVKKEIKQNNKTLKHHSNLKQTQSYDPSLPLVNIDLPIELEMSNTNSYVNANSNNYSNFPNNKTNQMSKINTETILEENDANAMINMQDNKPRVNEIIPLNDIKVETIKKNEKIVVNAPIIDMHSKPIQQTSNINVIGNHEPPYSNLKNGNKPSFKEWARMTQKVRPKPMSTIINSTPQSFSNTDKYNILINKPHDVLSEFKQMHRNKTPRPPIITKLIKRKTKTLKYNLGKKGKHVSVLIKNNNTRKKIKHEQSLLRQKPIQEIKDYLRNKNLIKSGTLAPNDVLREMYEQAILSGEVNNTSKDTLIHNFFTKETK